MAKEEVNAEINAWQKGKLQERTRKVGNNIINIPPQKHGLETQTGRREKRLKYDTIREDWGEEPTGLDSVWDPPPKEQRPERTRKPKGLEQVSLSKLARLECFCVTDRVSEQVSGSWDIEGLCPLILEKLEINTISRKTTPSISSTIQDTVCLAESTPEVANNTTTHSTDPGYIGYSTVLKYRGSTIVQDTTPTAQYPSTAVVSPSTILETAQEGLSTAKPLSHEGGINITKKTLILQTQDNNKITMIGNNNTSYKSQDDNNTRKGRITPAVSQNTTTQDNNTKPAVGNRICTAELIENQSGIEQQQRDVMSAIPSVGNRIRPAEQNQIIENQPAGNEQQQQDVTLTSPSVAK